VMQASELLKAPPKRPPLADKPVREQELNKVEDPSLRAALERLGRGVAAATSSPQGK